MGVVACSNRRHCLLRARLLKDKKKSSARDGLSKGRQSWARRGSIWSARSGPTAAEDSATCRVRSSHAAQARSLRSAGGFSCAARSQESLRFQRRLCPASDRHVGPSADSAPSVAVRQQSGRAFRRSRPRESRDHCDRRRKTGCDRFDGFRSCRPGGKPAGASRRLT
jgi:hypothetical protein